MNTLIKLLLILGFSLPTFAQEDTYIKSVYELASIKVEFYETSGTGVITPVGCTYCQQKTYAFDASIQIFKNNQIMTVQDFMKDYWNAKYPGLYINPKTNKAIKIKY